MASRPVARRDNLDHLSPLQRKIAYALGYVMFAPMLFLCTCIHITISTIVDALTGLWPSSEHLHDAQPPPEDSFPIPQASGTSWAFIREHLGSYISLPPSHASAVDRQRREESQTFPHTPGVLSITLSWLASPVKLFADIRVLNASSDSSGNSGSSGASTSGEASNESSPRPSPEASASCASSTQSVNRLADAGSIRRRRPADTNTVISELSSRRSLPAFPAPRTFASHSPARMRRPDGRPIHALPGVTYEQRFINPIPSPFILGLRRWEGELAGASSEGGCTVSSSSGHGRSLCSSSADSDSIGLQEPRASNSQQDIVTETRTHLTKGKLGSLRRLGGRIRKSVSLRRRRASMSLEAETSARSGTDTYVSPPPVCMRPDFSRSRSRSTSAVFPNALGLDLGSEDVLGWEYGLP